MIVADREWQRLFFEFSAYAARNDEFREELVTRYRSMRDRIAAALRARAEAAGFESALPYDQIALMTCAMANGVALEKLLEGEEVPDDLYGTMLTLLFAGLDTLKRSPEVAAAST